MQKAPYSTKSFRPKRNIIINSDWVFNNGPNAMVCLLSPDRIYWNLAKNCGPNIPPMSLAISRNPPFLNFNQPSRVPFSTARTNTLHPFVFSVPVYTIKPLNKHSRTLPFLNLCPWNLLPWSPLLCPLFSNNMGNIPMGSW